MGPGLCKNGCGLSAAKGRDAKGRHLTTCCRACALGMGHDKFCQEETRVAPGMCKMACGRRVAPGTTRSGNPYDTCCRDVAQGIG